MSSFLAVKDFDRFQHYKDRRPAWIKLYNDLLDDYAFAILPDEEKWRAVYGAISGQETEASRYVIPCLPAPSSQEWALVRQIVFERDGHTCTYCGSIDAPLEVDHIHPQSRGGGHELTNLTTACRPCNRSKRDRTPEEWKGARNV